VKRLRGAFAKRVREALGPMAERLRFVDESGVHLGLTRLFGRTVPEGRVVGGTPGYSGPHYTVVADLGLDGVRAPWVMEGAMTGGAFETYVERVPAPTLRPGEIVLMDNLSAHQGTRVRAAIEARGARLEDWPPDSSDLDPIEKCWSKVKAALRRARPRSLDELLDVLADAWRSVSRADVAGWFTHCGYPVKP
jgi:transposase